MAADGHVIIPPDSTGKSIDTSELTRSDGTVVERQRVVLGDPSAPGNFLSVGVDGAIATSSTEDDMQYLILAQLRRIASILELIGGVHVSVDKAF